MTRRGTESELDIRAASEADQDLMGAVIDDRYRVTDVIGEGGMGLVYRAEQMHLQRPVAIKVLNAAFSHVPQIGQRFEREAVAVARLDHPNCVSVLDFGRLSDGSLYLVMPYLAGNLLGSVVADAPMSPTRALHIARHVLAGLAHAHNAGIVHRDIKADNIMLIRHEGDPDFAKIFDFGIAKLGAGADELATAPVQLTVAGQRFGTPAYMSPEQSLGQPIDRRTDLYSLSVVLFEMLSGRQPFESSDPTALLAMHSAMPPPTLAHMAPDRSLSSELEQLVARGLAKRPDDRYQTAAEYLDAIDRIAAGTAADGNTTAFLSPSPPDRARKPLRERVAPIVRAFRNRWVQRGAAALGLALAIAVAFVLLRGPEPDYAARARVLLADGKPDDAIALLEDHGEAIEQNASAHLELGHAYAALRRYSESIAAYRRAHGLNNKLGDERALRTNLMLMLDDEREQTAIEAGRFLVATLDDDGARARIAELASRHDHINHRARMRELAEELELGDRIDRLTSYRFDLRQGETCEQRQLAIAKLRALGDAAAVATLKKVRRLKFNACIRDDIDDAIRYLESLDSDDEQAEQTGAAPQ